MCRVLLVEDDHVLRHAISGYLTRHDFAVDATDGAEEARHWLDTRPFDVVIADLRLGGSGTTEGLDVAEHALHHAGVPHVLILTAYSNDETVTRAAALGVAAVLKKPLGLRELVVLVHELRGGREAEAQ